MIASAKAVAPAVVQASDPREVNSSTNLGHFLVLTAQLGPLLLVFNLYHTMERPAFVNMSALAFAGFAVHYWLPFRFKEPFWAALSVLGSFLLVKPLSAELLLLAVGAGFFLILRSPIPYSARVLGLVAAFAALIYCRAANIPQIPAAFYPIFGAIFMFRMVVYAYDLAHDPEPASLLHFVSYFYLLPNYLFTLFPVIDFRTMRRTYYQRDIHEIAQQGIHWMARGAVQLMLYRLVVYFNDRFLPDRVTSLGALLSTMVLTYLLYLNVSGQFHIVVGMLHLFGYDLPETHRRYLLASGITDFWRRINIYWKDFMVKIVYFPVYFKLRKRGELQAQVIATAAVFLVTWVAHAYQFFWLRGDFEINWPDTIFWSVLGALVIVGVVLNAHKKRKLPGPAWQTGAVHVAKVSGTFALITTLWFLWSAPSVGAWIYLMTHWAQRN